jgi:23S rRNA pseudouridine1911/1915/1917 synthase
MNEQFTMTVPEIPAPVRIDRYLSGQDLPLSRSRIQHLIEQEQVFINGKQVKRVSEKVCEGDAICVILPPPEPSTVEPQDLDFGILYQDSHIVVVDKPAGLSVHPTDSHKTGTLVNGLLYRIKDLSGIGGVLRPGIVHRLDRVTSGVLIVAKTDEAHQQLSEDFKSRDIKKVYHALVHGIPASEEGMIDQPIGRDHSDRKRMCIREDGRNSLTKYKIWGRGLGGSFLKLYPYTGRTHQIRVHMKYLGCPLVGDPLYHHRKKRGRGEMERLFSTYPGIALHAHSIAFTHPVTREPMTFNAPLPALFESVITRMK